MARFWKVCWVGSICGHDLLGADGADRGLDREEGLGHLAGEALVGGRRVERDVLVPGGAGGGDLAAAFGRVLAGRGIEVVADGGETDAGLREGGPGGRVGRGALGLGVGGAHLGAQALDGGFVAAALAAVAGDGVTDAAPEAARADAEAHEAHEHEQGEAEIDRLDSAATTAATKIEQHGSGRTSPDRG